MKYIPPNKGRVYWFIASLADPYRYGVTFFIAAVLGYVWFISLYCPLRALVKLQQVNVEELYKKQLLYKQSRKEDSHLSEATHSMQRTLLKYSNRAHDVSATGDMMVTLVGAATASGLHFISCTCENQPQKTWTVGERFRCTFEGTLDQTKLFFQQLTTRCSLVSLYALDVTRTRNAVFSISCVVDMYTITQNCFTTKDPSTWES